MGRCWKVHKDRGRRSHTASIRNDHVNIASAKADTLNEIKLGMIGPRAMRSAIPWMTQISFLRKLGASSPRRAGRTNPAPKKRYRIAPIRRTHAPVLSSAQTRAESTSISAASVSISNRAPNSVDVPVRRATQPSTPSSNMIPVPSPTMDQRPKVPSDSA